MEAAIEPHNSKLANNIVSSLIDVLKTLDHGFIELWAVNHKPKVRTGLEPNLAIN